MSYGIRLARMEDARNILSIQQNALGYVCTLAQVQAQLERILKRPTDRVFVACDSADDQVVGFAHAADYETLHNGSMKNIVSLAVDERCRGLGLGRLLTGAVEQWAAREGCEAVWLVSGFNRVKAHAFYLHCGYYMRKEQKNFVKAVRSVQE